MTRATSLHGRSISKIIEDKNFEEVAKFDIDKIKSEHHKIISEIEADTSIIQSLKEKSDLLIEDCNRKERNLKQIMKYSEFKLTDLILSKMEKIKNYNNIINEKSKEMKEFIIKHHEIFELNKILNIEKQGLQDDIMLLRSNKMELERNIEFFTRKISDAEQSKTYLEGCIANFKTELDSLRSSSIASEDNKYESQLINDDNNSDRHSNINDAQKPQLKNNANIIYMYDDKRFELCIYSFNLK